MHTNAVLPPAQTHVLRERDPKIRVEATISWQVLWALTKMPPDAPPRKFIGFDNATYQPTSFERVEHAKIDAWGHTDFPIIIDR